MEIRHLKILKKYGYKKSHYTAFYKKWKTLVNNAPKRSCICTLTFEQYVKLAYKSDLVSPEQIGNYSGKYQMARYGDVGDYVWGNCRFITKEENLAEMVSNGGHARGRVKAQPKLILAGRRRRGLTKENCEWLAGVSESLSGRTAKTHEYVALVADSKARNFIAISPNGKRMKGRNVHEFCRKHELQQPNFHRVLSGERAHHKGWTGYYA